MYKVVIGLEVHCALNTKSKAFSNAKNEYSLDPNTNLSVIDLGFPGIMPYVNKEAVDKAISMALALNCDVPDELIFDRKNYFYPDLTKGYQITQVTKPIGKNGYLMMNVLDKDIKVLIHQIHFEEDTASLTHKDDYTLIDYNRSGVPLVEIVTEPCLSSAMEAYQYLETLKSILIYTNASFARGDLGQMRCDVNLSLMKDDAKELGTKVEVKNINSFYNVKLAIEYEIERQTKMLDNNEKIIQETRRFDEATSTTISMRTKVDAIDYKYFIEPNIPKTPITNNHKEELKAKLPMLAFDRVNKYINDYQLTRFDANILVKDIKIADYFEECISLGGNPKSLANWLNGGVLSYLNKNNKNIDEINLNCKSLLEIIDMVDKNIVSSKQAKELLLFVIEEQKDPHIIVEEKGMKQNSDDNAIRSIIIESINEKLELIEEYKKGRNVVDYFVGQVMKKTKGQANPAMTRNIVIEELNKYN